MYKEYYITEENVNNLINNEIIQPSFPTLLNKNEQGDNRHSKSDQDKINNQSGTLYYNRKNTNMAVTNTLVQNTSNDNIRGIQNIRNTS